jgi:dUTP diphosphatase
MEPGEQLARRETLAMILSVKNESGYELSYATSGSVGLDLRACCKTEHWLEPLERRLFNTGIHLELPVGFGAFVTPRSGLSFRGIHAALGIIDTDYRGPIGVILTNLTGGSYIVRPGDRIAQLVVVPVAHCTVVERKSLTPTARSENGFGSSGR